jgi:peptidoglycan L-alanyl-D-glutamate endopeptidase CwlK
MYKLSMAGKERYETLHPDLQKIIDRGLEYFDITLLCAHRVEDEQNEAFKNKLSKVQWPNSKHNSFPSEAMDVAPYFTELKNVDWTDIEAIAFMCGALTLIANQLLKEGEISCTLRWGGDWDGDGRTKDQKFMDYVHLERVPIPEA